METIIGTVQVLAEREREREKIYSEQPAPTAALVSDCRGRRWEYKH